MSRANPAVFSPTLYTRQQSDSVTLNTGEKVKFESIDSERVRIGTRYQHKLTNALSGYAGIAYDHEFGGKAKATTNGYKIDAPSFKGGSGMFEIGLTGKAMANKPLFLDLGIQGYAGRRDGEFEGELQVLIRVQVTGDRWQNRTVSWERGRPARSSESADAQCAPRGNP
ncbi:hypothetical protein FACS1894158_02880 [Betaproteobacteria bacterium]|nr:hypothetical protein FACS1894158_02880 [Betaproteobacteria bacterium]